MRIVIWGDSIAYGLGAKGEAYGNLIQAKMKSQYNMEVHNFAQSKFQLSDSIQFIEDTIALDPDLVIIAHGTTEAIVRPKKKDLKHMPIRWQNSQMDPRTYYSHRVWKRLVGRMDSAIRWRVKNFLIRHFGNETWCTKEYFSDISSSVVDQLLEKTHAGIVLLSHYGIDERYFPHSLESLNDFSDLVKKVASKHTRTVYCDVRLTCSQWSDYLDDHFHPNAKGHEKIANEILKMISESGLNSSIIS